MKVINAKQIRNPLLFYMTDEKECNRKGEKKKKKEKKRKERKKER
jgi:hypothetical protein